MRSQKFRQCMSKHYRFVRDWDREGDVIDEVRTNTRFKGRKAGWASVTQVKRALNNINNRDWLRQDGGKICLFC